jgi:hypothetical protein
MTKTKHSNRREKSISPSFWESMGHMAGDFFSQEQSMNSSSIVFEDSSSQENQNGP